MKCKGQVSRSGRLSAFYNSREFITDEELKHQQQTQQRVSGTRNPKKGSSTHHSGRREPPRRSNEHHSERSLTDQWKECSRRKPHRSNGGNFVSNKSKPFFQGLQKFDIAIDVVIAVFDTCGAYELSFYPSKSQMKQRADRKPHHHEPQHKKTQCDTRTANDSKRDFEQTFLEHTLHLRVPSLRNGEESTLVSALTEMHIEEHPSRSSRT